MKIRKNSRNTPETLSEQILECLAQPLCRNVSWIFVVNFLEDLPGIFLRIFLGTFSQIRKDDKSGDKIRERIIREKSGGPKLNFREKSVLPKTDPKNVCRR